MLGIKMSSRLKVRLLGDPVLVTKAKKVEEVTDEIRRLAELMLDAMYTNNGIGLAGNQVGVPLKIVVLDIETPHDKSGNPLPFSSPGEEELLPKMPVTLINPEIVSYSEELSDYEEGCLSVPKLYGSVRRPSKVTLKTSLLDGTALLLECGGLLARALQHELDHLDGVVFVQKVVEDDYAEMAPKLEKLIRKSGQKHFKVKRLIQKT